MKASEARELTNQAIASKNLETVFNKIREAAAKCCGYVDIDLGTASGSFSEQLASLGYRVQFETTFQFTRGNPQENQTILRVFW